MNHIQKTHKTSFKNRKYANKELLSFVINSKRMSK